MKLSWMFIVGALATPCVVVARRHAKKSTEPSGTKGSKNKKKKGGSKESDLVDLFLDGKLFFDDGTKSIGIDDDFLELVVETLEGLRIIGRQATDGGRRLEDAAPNIGGRILFGPTDDCSIGVLPEFGGGIAVQDPFGVRVVTPDGEAGSLLFGTGGDLGECRISADPRNGLFLQDPNGVRILTSSLNCGRFIPRPDGRRLDDCLVETGGTLFFGQSDDCRIRVNPPNSGDPLGLLLEDPFGVRLVNPLDDSPSQLLFGPTDECRIFVGPLPAGGEGMIFEDPQGFLFQSIGQPEFTMTVLGSLKVDFLSETSARRFKENIREMGNASAKLLQLRGVYFDWVEEKGGRADLGLIAEEVAEIFPEVVVYEKVKGGKDNTKVAAGVKYGHLVAVVIQAFKEQNSEIQDLNAKLTKQQKQMEEQEERLQKLEAEFKLLQEKHMKLA